MSLIPLEKDEIEIGKPLPWTIFDPQHNRLAVEGDVIKTKDHLSLLLDSNPCRELTWESGGDEGDADELSTEEITTAGKRDSAKQTSFPFEAMNLKVGDRLQIQPPAQLSMERFVVKLIGYLSNTSLLVTSPIDTNGLRLQLIEGEKLVVRIFSSQNAFGFASTIEKICKIPFDYLHLSFPAEVQGMVIRKAPRVKTRIIAAVVIGGQAESASAIISNLSANGALLDAKRNLAEKGDSIKLSFRVNLHNIDAYLTVNAAVRAVFSDEAVDNSGAVLIHHGLEFVDLQPNDSVILQSMIYQQMIERPHMMA
jgi:hypothetical protein